MDGASAGVARDDVVIGAVGPFAAGVLETGGEALRVEVPADRQVRAEAGLGERFR